MSPPQPSLDKTSMVEAQQHDLATLEAKVASKVSALVPLRTLWRVGVAT